MPDGRIAPGDAKSSGAVSLLHSWATKRKEIDHVPVARQDFGYTAKNNMAEVYKTRFPLWFHLLVKAHTLSA